MVAFFFPFLLAATALISSESTPAPSTETFLSTTEQEPKKYTLSIGGMFRNEGPYLKEWIEYHLLVGVEHFFLYNNESRDNSLEVLKPYLDQNIVELCNWPMNKLDRSWISAQVRAFNHCIKHCKGQTEWLAIIDVDEFLVPVDKPDLRAYLAQFDDQPSIGGIQVNWQLYGTSWLPEIPKNKLLVESLILKAPWDYFSDQGPHNPGIKTIVRPHAVDSFRVHKGRYKPGFTAFPPQLSIGDETYDWYNEDREQPIQIDHIRINHYWSRAEDFLYNVKIGRRPDLHYFRNKDMDRILKKITELNQVEDLIMMRFAPQLREKMGLEEIQE